MRTSKFLYGALGLLTLGMTACSSDAPEVTNGKAEKAEVRYMRVSILNTSSSTRATNNTDNFAQATDAESKVDKMWFTFYDAEGNPIYTATPAEVTLTEATSAQGDPSVDKINEAVVAVEVEKGENYPAYVMVFINPVNTDGFSDETVGNQVSMDDWRNQTRRAFTDGNGNFSMSNSAYYGDNDFNGASNVKIAATPISFSKLFTSRAKALEAKDEADFVNIYVERYAAKVNLTLGEEDQSTEDVIKPITLANGYKLTYTPQSWIINNDEASTYVVKRFSSTDEGEEIIPTYNEICTAIGDGWSTAWNDAALHRSYWACSPAYYNLNYPQVADNIIDAATDGTTGAGTEVSPYGLRYFSYKQVLEQGTQIPTTFGTTSTCYAFENTMASGAFASINPNACGPAALLVGQYSVATVDGNAIEGNPTFYLTGDDTSANLLFGVNPEGVEDQTALEYLVQQSNGVLAVNSNGELLTKDNFSKWKDYFEIAHPDAEVRQNAAVPNRYVTLQLKSLPPAPLYYNPMGTNEWVPLTTSETSTNTEEELLTTINTILWQRTGVIRAYTDGIATFHVMIQHLRAYEDGYNADAGQPRFIGEDGNIDWDKCKIGDFGLVRNHVYSLQIKEISGLGNGILGPDDPIVPPTKSDSYFIKYRLNMLNWRIVPTQDGIVL